jgi:hypothetical protein
LTLILDESYNAAAMLRAVRTTCVILTALAVLLVSATCTTAGCVFPALPDISPVTAERACCAHHHLAHSSPNSPTQPKPGEPCPLCRTTLLVGKSVDPNQHAPVALTLLSALFLSSPIAAVDEQCPPSRFVPNTWDAVTAHDPPTLFALHCALLN